MFGARLRVGVLSPARKRCRHTGSSSLTLLVEDVRKAAAAGIPVFTVDATSNEPGVKIVTQVATDNLGGGREAGRAMIEVLGDRGGKVGILHFKHMESCQLRMQGYREVIEAHNAGRVLGVANQKAVTHI